MKIIFLDFDRPLISHRSKLHPTTKPPGIVEFLDELPEPVEPLLRAIDLKTTKVPQFDPVAVTLVEQLVLGHLARVVISSSWRKVGRHNLETILDANGFPSSWLHHRWHTGHDDLSATRAQDITKWLDLAREKGEEIEAYAAIDDDPSISTLPGGILVPYSDGLRWADFCSASAALGGGFIVKNPVIEDGNLIAEISPGELGEMVVERFGRTPKSYNFGPIEELKPWAPLGCVRCSSSPYQLVRISAKGKHEHGLNRVLH